MNATEKKIKELSSLAFLAEREYSVSTNDEVSEEIQDAAYTKYWDYLHKIAAVIVDLIEVDGKTALKMAAHKSDEIIALLKKTAA
jgi:hypothetical protein